MGNQERVGGGEGLKGVCLGTSESLRRFRLTNKHVPNHLYLEIV